MYSTFNELEECNQHKEDGYEIESEFSDSEYEFEEVCHSSRGVDFYDENECYNDYDFLDCCTNVTIAMSSSCHIDNHN